MALSRQAEGGRTRMSEAAIAAFRAWHPEIDRLPASAAVARIIAWAACKHSAWFWRGVGLPERRMTAP